MLEIFRFVCLFKLVFYNEFVAMCISHLFSYKRITDKSKLFLWSLAIIAGILTRFTVCISRAAFVHQFVLVLLVKLNVRDPIVYKKVYQVSQ